MCIFHNLCASTHTDIRDQERSRKYSDASTAIDKINGRSVMKSPDYSTSLTVFSVG